MRQEEVIVEFFGWFEAGDLVFLAMEYFQFGDLSNYISTGEIAENDAKRITKDVLEALMLMHGEGFTHRDLKPKVRTLHQVLMNICVISLCSIHVS